MEECEKTVLVEIDKNEQMQQRLSASFMTTMEVVKATKPWEVFRESLWRLQNHYGMTMDWTEYEILESELPIVSSTVACREGPLGLIDLMGAVDIIIDSVSIAAEEGEMGTCNETNKALLDSGKLINSRPEIEKELLQKGELCIANRPFQLGKSKNQNENPDKWVQIAFLFAPSGQSVQAAVMSTVRIFRRLLEITDQEAQELVKFVSMLTEAFSLLLLTHVNIFPKPRRGPMPLTLLQIASKNAEDLTTDKIHESTQRLIQSLDKQLSPFRTSVKMAGKTMRGLTLRADIIVYGVRSMFVLSGNKDSLFSLAVKRNMQRAFREDSRRQLTIFKAEDFNEMIAKLGIYKALEQYLQTHPWANETAVPRSPTMAETDEMKEMIAGAATDFEINPLFPFMGMMQFFVKQTRKLQANFQYWANTEAESIIVHLLAEYFSPVYVNGEPVTIICRAGHQPVPVLKAMQFAFDAPNQLLREIGWDEYWETFEQDRPFHLREPGPSGYRKGANKQKRICEIFQIITLPDFAKAAQAVVAAIVEGVPEAKIKAILQASKPSIDLDIPIQVAMEIVRFAERRAVGFRQMLRTRPKSLEEMQKAKSCAMHKSEFLMKIQCVGEGLTDEIKLIFHRTFFVEDVNDDDFDMDSLFAEEPEEEEEEQSTWRDMRVDPFPEDETEDARELYKDGDKYYVKWNEMMLQANEFELSGQIWWRFFSGQKYIRVQATEIRQLESRKDVWQTYALNGYLFPTDCMRAFLTQSATKYAQQKESSGHQQTLWMQIITTPENPFPVVLPAFPKGPTWGTVSFVSSQVKNSGNQYHLPIFVCKEMYIWVRWSDVETTCKTPASLTAIDKTRELLKNDFALPPPVKIESGKECRTEAGSSLMTLWLIEQVLENKELQQGGEFFNEKRLKILSLIEQKLRDMPDMLTLKRMFLQKLSQASHLPF